MKSKLIKIFKKIKSNIIKRNKKIKTINFDKFKKQKIHKNTIRMQ
jgi:hypothetical protein